MKRKKLIFAHLFTLSLILFGCSSNQDEPNLLKEEVNVKLTYSFFESGSMSRNGGDEAYRTFYDSYIKTKQLAPSAYSLTFSTGEGSVMTVNGSWDGDDLVRLFEGNYNVSGSSKPTNYNNYYSDQLSLLFNEDIAISKDTKNINLTAKYGCSLLLFEATSIDKINIDWSSNITGVPNSHTLNKLGNYFYIFINNTLYENGYAGQKSYMRLNITRTNGALITINLNQLPFERGKFYYFNDATCSFDIPPMTNGN